MKFGEKLKDLRQKRKMTQDEVASSIGISRRAYIAYEQENVCPRKQETYDKLAKTLGCDVNYLKMDDTAINTFTVSALAAMGFFLKTLAFPPLGWAAAPSTLAAFLGKKADAKLIAERSEEPEESLTDTNDKLLQYEKNQKLFAVSAMGIIYKAAAEKGIQCQQGNIKDIEDTEIRPDDYIIVKNQEIQDWWLTFWAKDPSLEEHMIMLPDELARMMISRFAAAKSDPKRMATIIVNDLELYKAICRFKNHNSYRGNLSVILVDMNAVRISKETILSLYDDKHSKSTSYISVLPRELCR